MPTSNSSTPSRVASFNPDDLRAPFDLIVELLDGRYGESEDAAWITLYKLPKFVPWSVERVLIGSRHSISTGLGACLLHGAHWAYDTQVFREWAELREKAIKADYEDEQDHIQLMSFLNSFHLGTHDEGTGIQQFNLRTTKDTRKQAGKVARVLGLTLTTFARVAIMDALRCQADVRENYRQAMNAQVEEMYDLIKRRTKRLEKYLALAGIEA